VAKTLDKKISDVNTKLESKLKDFREFKNQKEKGESISASTPSTEIKGYFDNFT
jgi:hypothetical protein